MAKTTLATVKSFIRKNTEQLHIKKIKVHDSISLLYEAHPFAPVVFNTHAYEHRLGIEGVWFTFGGNVCTPYEDGEYKGFDVHNSCGHFVIAVTK